MTQMLQEILKLSEAERILLMEAIWDSIGEENTIDRISDSQEKVLKSRLESYRQNPGNLLRWDEVKASIKK